MDKDLLIDQKEFASIESGLSLISDGLTFVDKADSLITAAQKTDDPRALSALQISFESVCQDCGIASSDGGEAQVIASNESLQTTIELIKAFIKRMIDAVMRVFDEIITWIVDVFSRTAMARNMIKARAKSTLDSMAKLNANMDINVKDTQLLQVENLLEGWKMPKDLERSFTLLNKLTELIRMSSNVVRDFEYSVNIMVKELGRISEHNAKQFTPEGQIIYFDPKIFNKAFQLVVQKAQFTTNLIPTQETFDNSNLQGNREDYRLVAFTMGNKQILERYVDMFLPSRVFAGYYWAREAKPSNFNDKEKFSVTLTVGQARNICNKIINLVDTLDPIEKQFLRVSKGVIKPLLTAKAIADKLETNEGARHFMGIFRVFESTIRGAILFPATLSMSSFRTSFTGITLIQRALLDLEI